MDRIFINTITNAYYIDKDLSAKNFWIDKTTCVNELNNELVSVFSNLYLDNNELYYEAKSYPRIVQQEILYCLLDQYMNDKYYKIDMFKENIEENVIDVLNLAPSYAIIPISALILYFYKNLSRGAYRVLNGFDKLVMSIAGFVSKRLIAYRVKYSILIANLNVCQKKCGISSIKDLRATTGMGVAGGLFSSSPMMPLSQEAYKQAECLKSCYLEFVLEEITVLAEAYLECLRDSGEIPKILNDVSILLHKPTGENCIEYYNYIKKFDSEFRDALEVIFAEDKRGKQNILNDYNSRLEAIYKNHMYKTRS